MTKSVTSIYAFSKAIGVPRSTVVDQVTKLGFDSSKGLGEDQQRELLKELQSHPKLKAEYKQQIGEASSNPVTGHVSSPFDAASDSSTSSSITVSDVQPAGLMVFDDVEFFEPLELELHDNSEARSELDRQLEEKRQQLEEKRKEFEVLRYQKIAEDTRNRLAREKQIVEMIEMQTEADALQVRAAREGLVARKK